MLDCLLPLFICTFIFSYDFFLLHTLSTPPPTARRHPRSLNHYNYLHALYIPLTCVSESTAYLSAHASRRGRKKIGASPNIIHSAIYLYHHNINNSRCSSQIPSLLWLPSHLLLQLMPAVTTIFTFAVKHPRFMAHLQQQQLHLWSHLTAQSTPTTLLLLL